MISETMMRECERKFVDLRLDDVAPDGTFTGYASLFGVVDLARDTVERGAFAKSLKARGVAGIRMLYQHDPNEPIGTWTEISEDSRGLFVRGRLATGVERAREVLDLMRHGALDGLSIGFRASRARTDQRTGIRHIIEADLWEISIVTFPMLPGARVERVKGWRLPADEDRCASLKLARAIRNATRMINERKR
jgi:HK97 family phage prohead protease